MNLIHKFLTNMCHIILNFESDFLIVKSWNEWAEGNLLEPDSIYGFTMLKVMKEALRKYD